MELDVRPEKEQSNHYDGSEVTWIFGGLHSCVLVQIPGTLKAGYGNRVKRHDTHSNCNN